MERHGYTLERLEHFVLDEARAHILRERVTGAGVDAFVAERRSELDVALVAQLDFDELDEAEAVAGRLRDGGADFFALVTERAAHYRARSGGAIWRSPTR